MTTIPAELAGTMDDGTKVYRPRLTVTVSVGKRAVLYKGVVDSGADNTLIPAEWADAVGVKWASLPPGQPGSGAGGSLETRLCAAGRIYYAGILVCTGFRVAEPGKIGDLLLGRADFFAKFIPTFHWEADPPWFEIEPVA